MSIRRGGFQTRPLLFKMRIAGMELFWLDLIHLSCQNYPLN